MVVGGFEKCIRLLWIYWLKNYVVLLGVVMMVVSGYSVKIVVVSGMLSSGRCRLCILGVMSYSVVVFVSSVMISIGLLDSVMRLIVRFYYRVFCSGLLMLCMILYMSIVIYVNCVSCGVVLCLCFVRLK